MILSRIAPIASVIHLLSSCQCSLAARENKNKWGKFVKAQWWPRLNGPKGAAVKMRFNYNAYESEYGAYGSRNTWETLFDQSMAHTRDMEVSFAAVFMIMAVHLGYDSYYDNKPKEIYCRKQNTTGTLHTTLQVCIVSDSDGKKKQFFFCFEYNSDNEYPAFCQDAVSTFICGCPAKAVVNISFGNAQLGYKADMADGFCCYHCYKDLDINHGWPAWTKSEDSVTMPVLLRKIFSKPVSSYIQKYQCCSCCRDSCKSCGCQGPEPGCIGECANCYRFRDLLYEEIVGTGTKPDATEMATRDLFNRFVQTEYFRLMQLGRVHETYNRTYRTFFKFHAEEKCGGAGGSPPKSEPTQPGARRLDRAAARARRDAERGAPAPRSASETSFTPPSEI